MDHQSKYTAKLPDKHGFISYSAEENEVWFDLITRQLPIIQDRACQEFLDGLDILNFPHLLVPQCPHVSDIMKAATGWGVTPVPALISEIEFFDLLRHKKFPAASFIRRRDEFDYLQEPDIFHELFGHCPLLCNQVYADFAQEFGELGYHATPLDREFLMRIYWFTTEFGLINSPKGLKIYGGGILSSPKETIDALDSPAAERKPYNTMDVLRTPYRINIVQPIYYTVDSFQQLFDILEHNLMDLVHEAQKLGLYEPTFELETHEENHD